MDKLITAKQNRSMRWSAYLAAFVSGIIFCSKAQAAGFKLGVEPYLGYSELSYESGGVSDSKTGPILGGKGGLFLTEGLWFALDYHLGGPYNLANNDKEYLNRMWGAGVGFVKKGKVRAWLGYYFDNELDDTETGVLIQGTGLKVSVGMEFQAKLAINLEYCREEFDRVRANGQTTIQAESLNVSVIFLTLSSPLEIF